MANSASQKGSMRKSRSPAPPSQALSQSSKKGPKSYASEGATDNDIFLLPTNDYKIMGVMTALATAVRLFRISQPTSVVFDEVQ
jgi:dolichyl-phosphate-mannose-protein mannosyltransferase